MTNKLCWVAQAKRLLALYDLPSILALIQSPPYKLHLEEDCHQSCQQTLGGLFHR